MDFEHYYHAYLGTNSLRRSKGIYHVSIRKSDLHMEVKHTAPAWNGDYLTIAPNGKTLYAAYEVIWFQGRPGSGAGAYRIGEDGALELLGTRPTDGQMACFCSMGQGGGRLLVASYMSGTVTVLPVNADGSLGEDASVIRQPKRPGSHYPSVHSVYGTPDGRYIFSTNVGLDRVFLHRWEDSGLAQHFELPVEGRPRQAAFSPDGTKIYVSTESGGEVFVLDYDGARAEPLRLLQRISTVRPGWTGHAETAGIKLSPDGSMLVVTNRNADHNNLAVFSVGKDGLLSFTCHTPVQGVFPRDLDFTPDGNYLLVGLQFSDNLELFQVDREHGALISRRSDFQIPCCSGVVFHRGGGGHDGS